MQFEAIAQGAMLTAESAYIPSPARPDHRSLRHIPAPDSLPDSPGGFQTVISMLCLSLLYRETYCYVSKPASDAKDKAPLMPVP
ncbi:hypothetical protein VTL71DRAFT_16138 [Oculimacula yallundae]|uniref:Uncharacterized protein n=1 Tax=Oculimacula yallundae TaxID=86028 RepID=A0ABR4CDM9_9HELO